MQETIIKFGTDGWRSIIAGDFTFDNVALVAKAISMQIEEAGQAGKPLLVGYDHRFLAEAYAAHVAHTLEALGQPAVLAAEPCPTPVVAFGVLHLQAAGAIMLTASHNPFYFQGLKFIPHFAGPAMPETTDRITELIAQIRPEFTPSPVKLDWRGETVDLKEHYFEHLDNIVNQHSLSSSGYRVMYNPMHGLGGGYLDDYLRRAGMDVVTINASRDVYFGANLPDPSPQNLQPLAVKLIEEDCQLLIGTDGDADRFGFVDPDEHYFGANQALPLLADFLVRYKQMKGSLVRTVATSHLLDSVAQEHDLELIETAVGFKFVGHELQKGALIGGEESGGISIKNHMPEKDGILASLLMLELAATTGESFHELFQDMLRRLGHRAYIRIDQHMPDLQKTKLFAALQDYSESKLAGRVIIARNNLDGFKFLLDDGYWVLFRASGTEPVVRIYMEVTASDTLTKFKNQVLETVKTLSA